MKDVSSKVSPPWTGCGCLFAGTVRPLYLCSRLTLAANAVCWPLWTLALRVSAPCCRLTLCTCHSLHPSDVLPCSSCSLSSREPRLVRSHGLLLSAWVPSPCTVVVVGRVPCAGSWRFPAVFLFSEGQSPALPAVFLCLKTVVSFILFSFTFA